MTVFIDLLYNIRHMKKTAKKVTEQPIARNRQAFRDYHLFETLEVGLQLVGTEVKSLREGRCNLQDSYARFEKGELFLYNMHIPPYAQGNINNHDPSRPRKILLHKKQILRFYGRLTEKGLTMVPLKVYFKHGFAKCELALAKTKKLHDRREAIKKKTAQLEITRAMRTRNRQR